MDNTMLACGNRFGAVEWSECNSSPTQRKWSFGWNEVQAVLLRPAAKNSPLFLRAFVSPEACVERKFYQQL